MFKLLFATVLMFSTLQSAQAQTETQLSQEALDLVVAVAHTSKFKEFMQRIDWLSSARVVGVEDLNTYVLEGTILLGGDVPCGNATLTIKETRVPSAVGFGSETLYQGEIKENIWNDACKTKPERGTIERPTIAESCYEAFAPGLDVERNGFYINVWNSRSAAHEYDVLLYWTGGSDKPSQSFENARLSLLKKNPPIRDYSVVGEEFKLSIDEEILTDENDEHIKWRSGEVTFRDNGQLVTKKVICAVRP